MKTIEEYKSRFVRRSLLVLLSLVLLIPVVILVILAGLIDFAVYAGRGIGHAVVLVFEDATKNYGKTYKAFVRVWKE